ncbi:MAG: flagellar filament capping protein FliD [Burkholderiales bacterium]|nr:flagellar filament capping protein FliD [Burkholderiales bacterium]
MAITSGIGTSSIDVNSIVSQLMTVEALPLSAIDTKEASYQAQLSAYGALQGAIASLNSASDTLNDTALFGSYAATTSDTSIASASAKTGATTGSYVVDVTQLAQRQTLVAAGQASQTAAIGSGTATTISFQLGTVSGGSLASGTYTGATFTPDASVTPKSITIDAGNNTLAGIRDAINAANVGVTASIVNDGSGSPYRLVLLGADAGAAGSVRVSVSGDAAIESLLAHDPAGTQNLNQTTEARNAQFSVNGLAVSSKSNTVSSVLDGLTLTLSKIGTATINVSRSTADVTKNVEAFVKAYNDLQTTLGELTSYNAETKTGGVLLGDATARTLQSQIRNLLSSSISNTGSDDPRTLSAVGLTFGRDGKLSLDTAKLQDALTNKPEAVARLFASGARSTDPQVTVVSSGTRATAGTYAVNVTTLATQGKLVGNTTAALTITAGVNDSLSVTIDGTSATVTLAAGTYTAATLAAQVQASINGNSGLVSAGAKVTVTESAGVLTLASLKYGSVSSIAVSGNASTGLFGGAPAITAGVDVAGSIGGVDATGSGQRLTAAANSAATGLVIDVAGDATGYRGNVTLSTGLAGLLGDLLDKVLASDGAIAARTTGINRSITDLDKQRETLNRRLVTIEARYRAQYTALDTMMSSMAATSSFLSQQLEALNSRSSNR